MATDPQIRIVHRAPGGYENPRGNPAVAPDLVLVVDDEPEVRMLISGWLEAAGYRVRTATHADEAVRDLKAAMPAVLSFCRSRSGGSNSWRRSRGPSRLSECETCRTATRGRGRGGHRSAPVRST
jgi:hypothetical protein